MRRSEDRVAVVGIGGLFPGAGDLASFWANVRDARDGSSDPPPGRWPIPPEHVLDPRLVAPDKVPTLRGYYLPPFAYAYLQVVGEAVKNAGTLDQDKLLRFART